MNNKDYKFSIFVLLLCLHLFTGCKKDNPKKNSDYDQNIPLKHGEDINIENERGQSTEKTYLEMMRERYPEDLFLADLEKRVESGEDLNHQDKFQKTILHKASDLGYLKAVDFLLLQEVDVNLSNKLDMTPLNVSMAMGHYEVSLRLIEHGADVNIVDKSGLAPIHYAICSEKAESQYGIISLLIEKGANINGNEKFEPPIFLATSTKSTEALMLLIDNGADVNRVNFFGDTALFQAFISDNPEAFRVLLKNGANAEIKNNRGHSILEYINLTEDDNERQKFQKILKECSK